MFSAEIIQRYIAEKSCPSFLECCTSCDSTQALQIGCQARSVVFFFKYAQVHII